MLNDKCAAVLKEYCVNSIGIHNKPTQNHYYAVSINCHAGRTGRRPCAVYGQGFVNGDVSEIVTVNTDDKAPALSLAYGPCESLTGIGGWIAATMAVVTSARDE